VESERNGQVCCWQHRNCLTKGQFRERSDQQSEKEKSWKVEIFQIKLIQSKKLLKIVTQKKYDKRTKKESKGYERNGRSTASPSLESSVF